MSRHKPKLEPNQACPACGQHVSPARFRSLEQQHLTQAWLTALDRYQRVTTELMKMLDISATFEGDALRAAFVQVDRHQRLQRKCRQAAERKWKALERHYGHKLLPEELA